MALFEPGHFDHIDSEHPENFDLGDEPPLIDPCPLCRDGNRPPKGELCVFTALEVTEDNLHFQAYVLVEK